jgi:hypothetical protein
MQEEAVEWIYWLKMVMEWMMMMLLLLLLQTFLFRRGLW